MMNISLKQWMILPGRAAVHKEAGRLIHELESIGINIPGLQLDCTAAESQTWRCGRKIIVELRHYPVTWLARWFIAHELGHAIELAYHLDRRPLFRDRFSKHGPQPGETTYDEYASRMAAFSTVGRILGRRPRGYVSHYAAWQGPDEHWAEAFAYCFVNGFDKARYAPDLLDTCAAVHVLLREVCSACV